jgi:hypothetical protein
VADAPPLLRPDLGPPVEQHIAVDMVKRGLPAAPLLIGVGALAGGWPGAASVAFAFALVVVNFCLAAFLLSRAARISLTALGLAAFGGYLLRLALIAAAVLAVHSATWFTPWPFGLALIVTHLGLLVWEMRYVSTSLAFPGLKPTRTAARTGESA